MNGAVRFDRLVVHSADDLKGRTVRAGTFALGAEAVEFVLRVSSLAILARMLVPEHFGLIAMVTAITSIAERFKDLGLSIATVQREHITHGQVSALFWVNALVGAGLFAFVALLAQPLAHFYEQPRLVDVTLALSATFVLSGMAVQHQALLRRQMRFGQLAGIQIVASALSVVVAIVMAEMGFDYWALVAREVSRSVFMAVGAWVCMPWLPGRPSREVGVMPMLSLGRDVTAFNVIAFFTASLDQILIGKLFGANPLGLYRQGVNLVLAPLVQLTSPVNSVAESALSRLQSDAEKYRRYYLRILGALSMASMPLAVIPAVFAEEIVRLALGPKWMAAAEYFRILAIAAFVRPAMSTPGFVMVTQGRSKRYFWWGLVTSLFGAFCVAVGTAWGPIGVAYAQVASTYILLVPIVHWGLKGSPMSSGDFYGVVWRPAVASIGMGALLWFLKGIHAVSMHPTALLLTAAVLMLPVYLGIMYSLPGGRHHLTDLWTHFLEGTLARRLRGHAPSV